MSENLAAAVRYSELFAASPDAMFEIDRQGIIRLANDEAVELFGYTRDELIGQTVDRLVPERVRGGHGAHRAAYAAAPKRRPMSSGLDLWARRKDGSEFPADVKLGPVGTGDSMRIMCAVRDVTERRRAENEIRELNQKLNARNREVERANQMKSEFLASMSHELRTPLNAVIGFADLLKEQNAGPLNDKQRRYLDHISNGSRHLLALINDILDLSKIEAGKMETRTETFSADDAIEDVIASIRPAADRKELRMVHNRSESSEVSADRLHFRQIMLNLLGNAVKFTPSGGNIEIKTTIENGRCRTAVRDTGIGIKPEEIKPIFDSFHQAAPTTRGIKEGTGLGLAITQKLVSLNGGKIWVESSVGEGSCFFVELPLLRLAVPPHQPGPMRRFDNRREKPLILVAEDELLSRELMVQCLESAGYATSECASGNEAVARAEELLPDAITLDLMMPNGDGLQTLEILRRNTSTAKIPVVIVSVLDAHAVAASLSPVEYLTKPFDRGRLLSILRSYIPLSVRGAATVLAVDDAIETRYLIAEILEEAGYHCLLASSGEEAFDILTRTRPHAMILDLMMPGLNGFEILNRLRSDRQLSTIPVIILTGKGLNNQDLLQLSGRTQGLLLKDNSWKTALVEQLRWVLPTDPDAASKDEPAE